MLRISLRFIIGSIIESLSHKLSIQNPFGNLAALNALRTANRIPPIFHPLSPPSLGREGRPLPCKKVKASGSENQRRCFETGSSTWTIYCILWYWVWLLLFITSSLLSTLINKKFKQHIIKHRITYKDLGKDQHFPFTIISSSINHIFNYKPWTESCTDIPYQQVFQKSQKSVFQRYSAQNVWMPRKNLLSYSDAQSK